MPTDPLDALDPVSPDERRAAVAVPGVDAAAVPSRRERLGLWGEVALAVLPTATVLLVLWLIESLASRQVLFASLASSAFLIYRDPTHRMNSVRSLVIGQGLAALTGFAALELFGPGYLAAGVAVAVATFAMIALDAVHPPAMGTALSFAFRPSNDSNAALFAVALVLVALLAGLAATTTRLLARLERRYHARHGRGA